MLVDPLWQEMYEKRIDEMNAYRMKMFASLSHELRTPLNCSILMLQQLKTQLIEEGDAGAVTATLTNGDDDDKEESYQRSIMNSPDTIKQKIQRALNKRKGSDSLRVDHSF